MGKKGYVAGTSLWGGIDVGALRAGTQDVKPGLMRKARRDEGLPGNLRPDVTGLPVLEQIARVWGVYVIWSFQRSPSDDDSPEVLRVQRIAKMYADLRAAGFLLEDVTGLKEKHAKAWLQLLRARGYGIDTIRGKWSLLRGWCKALGKAAMVGLIEQYWHDAPKVERALKRPAAVRHQQAHGDSRVHAELLRAKDRTHWYVEQLCAQLHLTMDEAVRFSPALAGDYAAGQVRVRSGRGDAFRVIPIASDDERLLVQEVIEFIFSEKRKTLAWPNMRPGEAMRKHQQRLTYLRRKLSRHADGAESLVAISQGQQAAECAGGARSAPFEQPGVAGAIA